MKFKVGDIVTPLDKMPEFYSCTNKTNWDKYIVVRVGIKIFDYDIMIMPYQYTERLGYPLGNIEYDVESKYFTLYQTHTNYTLKQGGNL